MIDGAGSRLTEAVAKETEVFVFPSLSGVRVWFGSGLLQGPASARRNFARGESVHMVELGPSWGRWCVPVVLSSREHPPNHDDEFACNGGDGDVVGFATPQALEKGVERTGAPDELVSRLDADRAGVGTAPTGDVSGVPLEPGLVDRGVEAEVQRFREVDPGWRTATSALCLLLSRPITRVTDGSFPGDRRAVTTTILPSSRLNRVSRRGGHLESRTLGPYTSRPAHSVRSPWTRCARHPARGGYQRCQRTLSACFIPLRIQG